MRGWLWRALALLFVAAFLIWLSSNTRTNMTARGIQSGFDFLLQPAGFDIGEHAIAFESSDDYARAFWVGMLNTLRVAVPGMAFLPEYSRPQF